MLEYAEQHDLILLCLPSHTTQFLQPLDRTFLKNLKAHFSNACNAFVRANPKRKISRLQFGELLSCAWSKSATVDNAVSAFRATGICPLNPETIPDYAFLISENETTHTKATDTPTEVIPDAILISSITQEESRKTLKLNAHPQMEKALYTWFLQERPRGTCNYIFNVRYATINM